MKSLAIFLYPDRIGISRVNAVGAKPCYAAPQWHPVEDAVELLEEPVLFASTIREIIGDEERYDLYLNVWPGAYNTIMFSYAKKKRSDVNRLRQSELETVFRGEFSKLTTYDLVLDKDRPSFGGKSRRIIFVTPKERVNLMVQTLSAQKLNLCRIAPMDAVVAESALRYWAPKDASINVCLMLDDACTSVIFLRDGYVQSVRTMPDGFNAVLRNYVATTGLSADLCRQLIRNNGVEVSKEVFDMPTLQDEVLRTINKVAVEVMKTLHTVFGDEAALDNVLLCGNFARTSGLAEHLSTLLASQCVIVDNQCLHNTEDIVLDERDLEEMFPLSATAAKGADLMSQYKTAKSDRMISIGISAALGVGMVAMLIASPIMKSSAQKNLDRVKALLEQPEYVAVAEKYETIRALGREKNDLIAAIEALPHGGTNTAGIISDLNAVTAEYGTLIGANVDYNGKTVSVQFTTMSYDSFVLWQKKIVESGRFSFVSPPTFEGNGMLYEVDALMTVTDFEDSEEASVDE